MIRNVVSDGAQLWSEKRAAWTGDGTNVATTDHNHLVVRVIVNVTEPQVARPVELVAKQADVTITI